MGAQTSRRLSEELYEAVRAGRVDDVSQLSTHFTGDVDMLGGALGRACMYGQLNVVTWLVEHTVVHDNGVWLGWALVLACDYSHWNIVKWLLINTQVEVSKEAHFAGHNSILYWIISFNADKSRLINKWLDMTELCRRVYVCGENVNVQDNYAGDTPLHAACDRNNGDNVGALLLAGADETVTNDRGQTPVQYAVVWGRVKVLPLLDVSSEWKLLIRSHRLRRRTAVRVMMTLVKWKVQQTRSMWTRAIMTLHTIMALVTHEDNDEIRNCCWLNIRDCMFAVACCCNTRSYSRIE
jgi:hypothetical protein